MTASPTTAPPSRLLEHHCQEIIAAEVARLARRAPALADGHLGTVEASLRRIVDRLLPARTYADAHPAAVLALFDLEES